MPRVARPVGDDAEEHAPPHRWACFPFGRANEHLRLLRCGYSGNGLQSGGETELGGIHLLTQARQFRIRPARRDKKANAGGSTEVAYGRGSCYLCGSTAEQAQGHCAEHPCLGESILKYNVIPHLLQNDHTLPVGPGMAAARAACAAGVAQFHFFGKAGWETL